MDIQLCVGGAAVDATRGGSLHSELDGSFQSRALSRIEPAGCENYFLDKGPLQQKYCCTATFFRYTWLYNRCSRDDCPSPRPDVITSCRPNGRTHS